mgnify:CR=1 FL=1
MDKRKIKKFERICNELSELMEEMHEINPNIELFIAGEIVTSALLIDNKGKDDDYWRKNQDECILSSVALSFTDCGGI